MHGKTTIKIPVIVFILLKCFLLILLKPSNMDENISYITLCNKFCVSFKHNFLWVVKYCFNGTGKSLIWTLVMYIWKQAIQSQSTLKWRHPRNLHWFTYFISLLCEKWAGFHLIGSTAQLIHFIHFSFPLSSFAVIQHPPTCNNL
jgi:hypothetical protein